MNQLHIFRFVQPDYFVGPRSPLADSSTSVPYASRLVVESPAHGSQLASLICLNQLWHLFNL